MARISDGFVKFTKASKDGSWVSLQLQQERFQAHSKDFKRRGHTYQMFGIPPLFKFVIRGGRG